MIYKKLLMLTFMLICSQGVVGKNLAINTLKNHPSPYLAMHSDDPVHWQRWNNDIFAQAKKQNKLIFVSIGYFSCHWCHVMQKESYQNTEIAALINKHFIAVKVDRELQPALDARLISYVESTRGYAGWPLNVFITPEGYPIYGLVYLPSSDFKDLLEKIAVEWSKDFIALSAAAKSSAEELIKTKPSIGSVLNKKQIESHRQQFVKNAMQIADDMQGGFGESSKFPLSPQFSLLLDIYQKEKDNDLGEFLKLTLDKMSSQGMHDHLRGGFYRYTVDPSWRIPHFEKMLYDNVQLIDIYLKAADIFDDTKYKTIAFETINFLDHEFKSKHGGFISSLSALDNKNVEGGYYLWSNEKLKKILSNKELEMIKEYWGMQYAPTLIDGHHPIINTDMKAVAIIIEKSLEETAAIYKTAKNKLLAAQTNRTLPRDGKLLASWNGLALEVLSKAAINNPQIYPIVKHVRKLITDKFWSNNILHRAYAKGKHIGDSTLEDYAYIGSGLLAWHKLTGEKDDLVIAEKIIQQGWQRFYNDDGWILSDTITTGISSREGIIADGPMPSASATLIKATLELAKIKNDAALIKRAKSALNRNHDTLSTDNFWYASHISTMLEALSD